RIKRRGFEHDPTSVDPRLGPGMAVERADFVVARERIALAERETRRETGRNADLAQHDDHSAREELAMSFAVLEQEPIQGRAALIRHDRFVAVRVLTA